MLETFDKTQKQEHDQPRRFHREAKSRPVSLSRCQNRRPSAYDLIKHSGGQIVVEYVLLLIVALTLAIGLTSALIGRNAGSEGVILTAWQAVINAIGADNADDIKR